MEGRILNNPRVRSFAAISSIIASQAMLICGCVGKIKQPRSQREDVCEQILADMSEENSSERVKCMENNKRAANKKCSDLQNEETNSENLDSKLDCIEYKYRTDPPKEGVNVLSWH